MISKKSLFFLTWAVLLFAGHGACQAQETIKYGYDELDRLVSVEYVGAGSIHYRYDQAGDIINLTILVTNGTVIDSDNDGIADDWEILYFDKLASASATTDFDNDGYSDLWEYINWKNGILDSDGKIFSPLIHNSPGGPGYNGDLGSSDFWLLIMPALLNNNLK
jgi:YD repeat-containing protein